MTRDFMLKASIATVLLGLSLNIAAGVRTVNSNLDQKYARQAFSYGKDEIPNYLLSYPGIEIGLIIRDKIK